MTESGQDFVNIYRGASSSIGSAQIGGYLYEMQSLFVQ